MHFFKKEFFEQVVRHLSAPPAITGLTFGVEKGRLARMTMFAQPEYVGRALNVACRLQKAVKARDKDKDGLPAYKALVSNVVFNEYFSPVPNLKTLEVKRTLENIQNGADFHCKEIDLI